MTRVCLEGVEVSPQGYFSTRDVNLAAFLWVYRGLEPVAVRVGGGSAWLDFNGEGIRQLKTEYYRGRAVSALRYAEALRECRRMVRDALKETR